MGNGGARAAKAAALVSALALSSCAEPEGAVDWTVSVDTVDGTIRVVNTPPASGAEPTMRADEDLRIGEIEGGGPAQFGRIRTIAVLEDGRIAVADAQAEEVRLFDRDGQYIRTFGGRGGGPGELQGMQGVYLDPEGLLRVPEQENARLSVFDPDTGFVRSYPLYLYSYSFSGPWKAAFDSAGKTLLASAGLFGEGRYWNMLRIYDKDMLQIDSVPYYDYTDDGAREHPGVWNISMGTGTLHVRVPFYPMPQETLSSTGEFWTSSDGAQELEVARWTPPHDTTLVIVSRRPVARVTAAERDSAMAEVTGRLEGRIPDGARLDVSKIPSFKPPVQGLSFDDRGRLWARLSGSGVDPTVYDIFNQDGTHAETVSLPFSVDVSIPPITRGEEIWAVVTDEFDVQYVVRARMRSVKDD
jgi:hypothetical protein